jgi:hypothetical protein
LNEEFRRAMYLSFLLDIRFLDEVNVINKWDRCVKLSERLRPVQEVDKSIQ